VDVMYQNVQVLAAGVVLEADITLPDPARGLVLLGMAAIAAVTARATVSSRATFRGQAYGTR
jgi:hypothetical protein